MLSRAVLKFYHVASGFGFTRGLHTGCKGSTEMSSKVGFWDVMRLCHDVASEVREGSQEAVLEPKLISLYS